ncbi:MAG: hypothetical protein AAGC44_04565 [Planctomycetota bacterium]
MPNGKPGDHPITDTVHHDSDIFPSDVKALILKVWHYDSHLLLDEEELHYAQSNPEVVKRILDRICRENNIPVE